MNQKTMRALFFIYFAVLAVDGLFLLQGKEDLRLFTKPFLAPLLLLAIWSASKKSNWTRIRLLALAAFFCCFVGDVILLDDTNSHFIMGLIAFLVSHILFTTFFFSLSPLRRKHTQFNIAITAIIGVYCLSLLLLIGQSVPGPLRWPVTIYAVVLGGMLLSATNTVKDDKLSPASMYFLTGAILFVFSDSLLAVARFYVHFKYADVLVMATYGTAIFLLACGILRFFGVRMPANGI